MALEFTDNNFENEVINSEQPVLVDFWAPWCAPCRMVGPIVDELAKEYEGRAKIGKVDVDDNQQIAIDYGIKNIPTLLFIKNGKVVDKILGVEKKNEIKNRLDALLN